MQMGKNNLYVLDLKTDQVHEDDAVMALASALSGPGVTFSGIPSEGKLELRAAYPGLFKVNILALESFQHAPGCHVRFDPQPDSCNQRPEPGSHPGHPPGE
jgi:hypothetical protein